MIISADYTMTYELLRMRLPDLKLRMKNSAERYMLQWFMDDYQVKEKIMNTETRIRDLSPEMAKLAYGIRANASWAIEMLMELEKVQKFAAEYQASFHSAMAEIERLKIANTNLIKKPKRDYQVKENNYVKPFIR
jgi:hypothetical protein